MHSKAGALIIVGPALRCPLSRIEAIGLRNPSTMPRLDRSTNMGAKTLTRRPNGTVRSEARLCNN